MVIKYKNIQGNLITYQQSLQVDEYYKAFYENDLLVKEEAYYQNELYGITYYNINDDTHTTILSSNFSSDVEFNIVDEVTYSNGYYLKSSSSYSDVSGMLSGKTNRLYNPNGDLVGNELFLEDDNTPQYQSTYKYYYDRNINPLTFLFEVKFDNITGDFDYITFNEEHKDLLGQDSFALTNSSEDIQTLKDITGMTQELVDYYLSPSVIPTFS